MGPKADSQSAAELIRLIEEFLAAHPQAAILEDGRVVFDLRTARCTLSDNHGRCVLQLWSEERNLVRTVTEIRDRAGSLRIVTRRMGAPRPQTLELVSNPNRRTPTTRDTARRNYQRLLERVLSRAFIGATLDGFRSAMDLENSFGPAYIRGRLFQGAAAHAVIGVSAAESSSIVDGVLTLGILWLDYCRQHSDGRRHFGGLKVIVPAGAGRTTAERMLWLNHAAAGFQLFTLDERSEELAPVDFRASANIESHLVHAFSPDSAVARCQPGLDRFLALVPEPARARVEIRPRSSTEVALFLHGLDFARVRHTASPDSFELRNELYFGAGPSETPLTPETEPMARELFAQLFRSRHPQGLRTDPLFRLQPERWLESLLRTQLAEFMPGLRADLVSSQVPAISSGERGLLDLLTLDRTGRLTILELKADEDLHLPLQALDYWIRVRALNDDRKPAPGASQPVSAFTRAGYFPGLEVSPLPPRLLLAAPALRLHPANEPVLRYLSPDVAWELIGLDENWRSELKILFRKRSSAR